MKKIYKNLFLFLMGFMGYITIETLWRGYSFRIMGLCGGLAIFILDKINDKISWDIDILLQGLLGSKLITLMELVIGELSLHNILPKMWDYSNVPLNYKGIICIPFSLLWILLSIFAIIVADTINYYFFDEKDVPYYRLFGKVILRFKEK